MLGAKDFSLLTTDAEKNELFAAARVDFVCADDFETVKDFSPEEFCAYLTKRFAPRAVVCGENLYIRQKCVGRKRFPAPPYGHIWLQGRDRAERCA